MYVIDRTTIVIRPKKPFYKWLQGTTDPPEEITLEQLRAEDCNSYLIPEVEDYSEVEHYLEGVFPDIFQAELSGWIADPAQWPKDVDFEMFMEWFDVEVHSMVFDMVVENAERESFFDEEAEGQ